MVDNWLNSIQDCLFPPTCLLCGRAGSGGCDLCAGCRNDLVRNVRYCPRCAAELDETIPADCLCGQCVKQLPAYDRIYAPFLYRDAVRYLIHGLKFQQRFHYARLLGTLLAEGIDASALPELLIPVPLHPARYRERGFNQAIEITKTAAKLLALPVDFSSCRRHRNTPHQTGLTAKQRRSNLRNAFLLDRPVTAQHVAIVDDVVTSATTVNELAKALKKDGVAKIDVWSCARA